MCMVTSVWTLLYVYGAPMFVFGTWLVVTTFLHHNDEAGIPWFSGDKWSYVRVSCLAAHWPIAVVEIVRVCAGQLVVC
jgi:hypothetical protein